MKTTEMVCKGRRFECAGGRDKAVVRMGSLPGHELAAEVANGLFVTGEFDQLQARIGGLAGPTFRPARPRWPRL